MSDTYMTEIQILDIRINYCDTRVNYRGIEFKTEKLKYYTNALNK